MPRVDPRTAEGESPDEPTLVQYWDAEQVPDYITDELNTFTDHNPDFRHLIFSREAAAEFIARHFTPREVAAFRSCAVPSMQSDYLRFCAGLVFDGIYSDVDFRCLASLRPLMPAEGRIRVFRGPKGGVVSGFYAFRSPGHPFLRLALEIATVNIENRFEGIYFSTGPGIFTGLVALHACGSRDGSIPLDKPRLQAAAREYWKVIENRAKLSAALNGIEVRPPDECLAYIEVATDLAYKKTSAHWLRFEDDVFI
jgi:hypothetical protein